MKKLANSLLTMTLATVLSTPSWARTPRMMMATAEQSGIFHTGGLGHASAGLIKAANQEGVNMSALMPFYLQMDHNIPVVEFDKKFHVELDPQNGQFQKTSEFALLKTAPNAPVNPTFFLRHNDHYRELNYFDNREPGKKKSGIYAPDVRIGESFAAWAKAAGAFIISQNLDVVYLNDWPGGMIAAELKLQESLGKRIPAIIGAIHNLAYQGVFPSSLATYVGFPQKMYTVNGFEFYNQMSFLKALIQYSDVVYTVSEGYSKEIATSRFGAGLEGLIQEKAQQNRVLGILNGIDNEEWDPSKKKPGLEHTFSIEDMTGKARGKAQLQQEMGFEVNAKTPLLVLTSRLAEQKGYEYMVAALEKAVQNLNVQVIVSGDAKGADVKYQKGLEALSQRFPGKFKYLPFSGAVEAKITRYADAFMNGSWFEPSGLNQMFALRNGTVPVVSAVGGLKDSVIDGKTGIRFEVVFSQSGSYDVEATKENAFRAIERLLGLYGNPLEFRKMQVEGMKIDNSWNSRFRSHFVPMHEFVLQKKYKEMPFSDYLKTYKPKSQEPIACSVFAS